MLTQAEKSILSTLVWFDLFDWPLSKEEIWKYLWSMSQESGIRNQEFREIQRVSDKNNGLKNIVETKDRFYFFLKGREELIRIRKKREGIAPKKLKKARQIARLLGFIPWVKMIGLGNIMGKNNFKEQGDLDFFIITAKNRIWSVRFFAVSLIEILGLRLRKNKKRDKVCLNFFVSEDNLNLEPIALKSCSELGQGAYDIYLAYWIHFLIPLCDRTNTTYRKFLEANKWTKNFLPNIFALHEIACLDSTKQTSSSGPELGLLAMTTGITEKFFCWVQLKIMPKKLKAKAKTDSQAVIINDKILKLHTNEGREEYRKKWKEGCSFLAS